MNRNGLQLLWRQIEKEETARLTTSAGNRVTMHTVSPALHQNAILMFTHPDSAKYRQIRGNHRCCLKTGRFFVESEPEFRGHTMLAENTEPREVCSGKFSDAFKEAVEFGGRNAVFILLKPIRATGGIIGNGLPAGMLEHCFDLAT